MLNLHNKLVSVGGGGGQSRPPINIVGTYSTQQNNHKTAVLDLPPDERRKLQDICPGIVFVLHIFKIRPC
jgi:hypothetical protein